jgi:hypothetical protein
MLFIPSIWACRLNLGFFICPMVMLCNGYVVIFEVSGHGFVGFYLWIHVLVTIYNLFHYDEFSLYGKYWVSSKVGFNVFSVRILDVLI